MKRQATTVAIAMALVVALALAGAVVARPAPGPPARSADLTIGREAMTPSPGPELSHDLPAFPAASTPTCIEATPGSCGLMQPGVFSMLVPVPSTRP